MTLDGIRSYHEPVTVDLTGVRCASVVGRNGAGKSTILTSVVYALFGLARGADELLSHDVDRGEVTVTFEIQGERFKVARGRERGRKPWLSLARWDGAIWMTVPTHTIAETQATLTQILGMTEDVFSASVFSPQGQAGALIHMTPGRRKQLLAEMLGIDVYENYREQFAADLRSLDQRLAIVFDRMDRLRQEIEHIVAAQASSLGPSGGDEGVDELLELARQEAKSWQENLDAAAKRQHDLERYRQRQQLTRQINAVVDQGKQLKQRRIKVAERRRALVDLEPLQQAVADAEAARNAELERVAAGQGVAQALRAEADAAFQALKRAVDARSAAERASQQATAHLAVAQDAFTEFEASEQPVCDRCGQVVAGEHREQAAQQLTDAAITADLHASEQAQLLTAARQAEAEARDRQVLAADRASEDAPRASPTIGRALLHARDALEAAQREITEVEVTEQSLAEQPTPAQLRGRWDALRAERDVLPLEPPRGLTVEECRARLAVANADVSEAEALQIAAQDRAARRVAAEADLAREEAGVQGDQRRREALSVLERACSRNGIPAALLDGAVAGVEQATNEALQNLGSTFSVRLDTQRELKSGGLGETLDIVVDDGLVERTLETFSGGEQYRVHMALRLGLAQALGRRSMDCVLIDEVTDLDDDGVRQLAGMLTRLPDKQVLLVTHAEDLVEALPQRITVSRNGVGSASRVELQL